MRGFTAAEFTVGAYALAAAGINLSPDAIDSCPFCPGSKYRRKNTYRHRMSRTHRKRMMRALG